MRTYPKQRSKTVRVLPGFAQDVLPAIAPRSVQTAVTSPPYYGLRDNKLRPAIYGGVASCKHVWLSNKPKRGISGGTRSLKVQIKGSKNFQIVPDSASLTCPNCTAWMGQLGLERTPQQYVRHLVEIFRQVRLTLKDNGTLWLNMADSFTNKSLSGVPWLVALALRDDGWFLRQTIIWHKPNAMPHSVEDRPLSDFEYVFLLSKSARYYYDYKALEEPFTDARRGRDGNTKPRARNVGGRTDGYTRPKGIDPSANSGRRGRAVWSIPTVPSPLPHFSAFPPELPRRCIVAGSKPGDVVLDPFVGVGTTLLVARNLGRSAIGIEPSPKYCKITQARLDGVKNKPSAV